jgi:hypothetical protein
MKKQLLKHIGLLSVGILLIINYQPVLAQDDTDDASEIGIKGGANLSYLTIEDADQNNMIIGYHAGLYMKAVLTESIGLQPEILYSKIGGKATYDTDFLGIDVADGETILNMNYINIPIKLLFRLSDNVNVQFGPYASYLLNSNVETDAEILEFIEVDSEDDIDKDEFNPLDYGLTLGLEFDVDPVVLGANYNFGLQKVAKDDESLELILDDAKNQYFQIYIGLGL